MAGEDVVRHWHALNRERVQAMREAIRDGDVEHSESMASLPSLALYVTTGFTTRVEIAARM